MQTIYLFSGLGADQRIFKYLEFTGFETVFVKWVIPVRHESIEAYAGRIAQQITTPQPILIGVSFGGIMAIEVAKLTGIKKLIIIASVKQRKELPFYFRFAGYISLHRIIPAGLMKWPNGFSNRFFGAETKEDRKMLADILNDTDPVFLKWAIHALVNWKNENVPPGIIHIHGSADKVLPMRYVDADIIIENGNHLMILNKPGELDKVLKEIVNG